MSLSARIRRPVVILSASTTDEIDDAGDAVEQEVAIETVAELQPRQTGENAPHPDIAESDWVGYFLPADLGYLTSASEVWAPTMGTYEILGDPQAWRKPGAVVDSYVEANLKRVAGPEDDRGSS